MRKFAICYLLFAICASAHAAAPLRIIPAAIDARVTTTTRAQESGPGLHRGDGNQESVVSRSTQISNQQSVISNQERTGINATGAVRRAGITLRPTVADFGGRATIAGTGQQTGSNISNSTRGGRVVSARAAAAPTAQSMADATARITEEVALNKSCSEQYNDCMDQFCNVIDTNQKRCSCSASIAQYEQSAEAVKEANAELNAVAQRIRYVGLSADEIRAIMTATEAEMVLDKTVDNTQSRDMLSQIEDLIRDPSANVTTTSNGTLGILDIDLNFSSDASDMFSLDMFNGGGANSFTSRRGTELYNSAKSRCSAILSRCTSAGATSAQITGNYDLAIDRDCITYEQGLEKMNDTLRANVRSANQMLQKARLAVLNNKNQYDAKGCVAALETCMKDEMVCGADYTKCLDPTKKYIDENGAVVLGNRIATITDFMTNYNNADINSERIKSYMTASYANCGSNGSCIVRYLMEKIGTGDKPTDGGLCRAVLDKCQRYTYNARNEKYNPYNDIIVNYVQRAMVNVMAGQRKLISDYAGSCMSDVADCYNQQVSQVNAWSTNASANSVYNVMRGACRNVALTCAYAVFEGDVTPTAGCPTGDDSNSQTICIEHISDMFYQSLLCPDNSVYVNRSETTFAPNGTVSDNANNAFVNAKCKCTVGYMVFSGECLAPCSDGYSRNSTTGVCVKNPTQTTP